MNICIGIISYLPDDNEKDIRNIRQNKLLQLIDTCNKLFDLPIVIIAQNWKDFKLLNYNNLYNVSNCDIHYFDKPLGIIEARKELRRVFIMSNYDYIIMLDDDCSVSGTKDAANRYIDQIKEHPGMYGLFCGTLLKLFAISKEMFKLVDFRHGRVEDGDFFEDILFVETLKKLWPNRMFQFRGTGLIEKSNNYNDTSSTWYHGQFDKHEIGDRTRAILGKIK